MHYIQKPQPLTPFASPLFYSQISACATLTRWENPLTQATIAAFAHAPVETPGPEISSVPTMPTLARSVPTRAFAIVRAANAGASRGTTAWPASAPSALTNVPTEAFA